MMGYGHSRVSLHIVYKIFGILVPICLGLLATYINTDYGFYGVAIILLFYMFRNHKYVMAGSFAIATIINYIFKIYSSIAAYGQNIEVLRIYIILCFCTIAPILLMLLYNSKKGKDTKHLLYLFYPVHLLLIYGIYLLL